MADLNDKDISQPVKISGANPSTGVETNYLDIDSSGRPTAKIQDSSGNNVTIGQKTMANGIPVTIASDQTAIPVATAGGQNDLQLGRLFSVAVPVNMPSSGVDNPCILFTNPGGSGKTAYIKLIMGGVAVSNKITLLRLFAQPTITVNGTAIPIVQRNIGNATASVMNLYSTPTISANGNRADNTVIGPGQNSAPIMEDFNLAVQPGESFLITGNPDTNNVSVSLKIVWMEQ